MSVFIIIFFTFILKICGTPIDEKKDFSQQKDLIVYVPEIIETLVHQGNGATQGLIFDQDTLYESTGIYGHSTIRKITTGGIYQEIIKLPASIYGEGIAIHNNCLYVLSWKENTCFVYDLNTDTPQLKERIYYAGEGWGLCKDATSFWMSSGGFYLTRVSLDDFFVLEKREIFLNEAPLGNLNELEFVNGLILANVWQSNFIVIYDPQKNQTVGIIELENLVKLERTTKNNILFTEPEAVLNGIAYHQSSNSLYITGKYWKNLFKIKIKRKNSTGAGISQLQQLEQI